MFVLYFYAGKVMNEWLQRGETWDDLVRDGLGIIQPVSGYRFAMDAVLLAYFAVQTPAYEVLDLGTGCGVIPILLASRLPKARITGVEIQAEQADRALRSVKANGLLSRITIVAGDLRSPELLADQQYDLITCNPPFFPRGRGKLPAQTSLAVSRHEILCTLSDVFFAADRSLSPVGRLCIILPVARRQEALVLASAVGFSLVRSRAIHPREEREANLLLLEFVKLDGPRDLLIESPLYVYQSDGSYTPEIREIYFAT